MKRRCQDLAEAHQHLPGVLQLLTNISLESMAELIPAGDKDADVLMAEHFERVSGLCAQVQLDADKLNSRWNKTYGESGTNWKGSLQDSRPRGGIPYFCPDGWARFSLNVCSDGDFEEHFKDWGYLYHGTKGKYVGSILTSGLRASQGLCFCGNDDHAVYMSPSIEYCGHPRYARIEFNPETKLWTQVVLQCRVKPEVVWKKCKETMECKKFDLKVDPNIENDHIEWLIKPNYIEPGTQHKYLKDAVVCTGIMVRITKQHPVDMDYWWSSNKEYVASWGLSMVKVDPIQKPLRCPSWKAREKTKMKTYKFVGDPLGSDFVVRVETEESMGTTWMAPLPFANGSMRFAYYLNTSKGTYVVKPYNEETKQHIQVALECSLEAATMKDVTTYLVAQHFADQFNNRLPYKEWNVQFVKPCVFFFGNECLFGEPLIEGRFLKWNNNSGEVNMGADAKENYMDEVASSFSHFTYAASKGRLLVVDIQGWDVQSHVIFTDPQIHTRSFNCCSKDRRADKLFRRYSIANFGKTGMIRFLSSHECSNACKVFFGLRSPLASGAYHTGMIQMELNLGDAAVSNKKPGDSMRSPSVVVGKFAFRLLVFPSGTTISENKYKSRHASIFLEVCPPGDDPSWVVPGVKYSISVWNRLTDKRMKNDTFTFDKDHIDRGWHDFLQMKALPKMREEGWVNEHGKMCISATVDVPKIEADDVLSMISGDQLQKEHWSARFLNRLYRDDRL